jgi:hypothetical protein
MKSRKKTGGFQGRGLVMAGLLLLAASGMFACTPKEKQTFTEALWEEQVAATRISDLYAPNVAEDGRTRVSWMWRGGN